MCIGVSFRCAANKISHSKLTVCLSVSNLDMPLITLVTLINSMIINVKFRYADNYINHSKITVNLSVSNLDMPLITLVTVK